MARTLSNKCAKNLSKRTVLLQLIIKNVVTCFLGTQCIVTMAVSVAVCEMFSVKEMSDPKPRFHGHDICQRQMSPYGRRNG